MNRRSNYNLIQYVAAGATLAALTGCHGMPRAPEHDIPETRCRNPNYVAGTAAAIVAEPLIVADEALQGFGQYVITGSRANDLMTGGALVRDGDESVYDGPGESVARSGVRFLRTNAAAGALIYGALNSGGSSSSGANGSGPGFIYEETGGPGTR